MDFGEELRRARERKGVSLQEIAESTKISARALDALEKNDISRLPGGIFTRAIIRSYAAEVGLDPDQAMRTFTEQFPGEGGSWVPEQTDDNFESRRQAASVAMGIAALTLAVLAVFVLLNFRGSTPSSPSRATGTPPPDALPTDAATAGADTPPSADTPIEPPFVDRPTTAPSLVQRPLTSSGPPLVPHSGTGLTLAFQPTAPCWVSVTVDGRRLYAREIAPGEVQTVRASQELVRSVGDACSFNFSINGSPGRALGRPGQVVNLRITPDNYRSLVAAAPLPRP